jgi:hypothetical protein
MDSKGTIAISQIMVLLVGTFAIAWAIGGGIGFVSGDGTIGTACYTDRSPSCEGDLECYDDICTARSNLEVIEDDTTPTPSVPATVPATTVAKKVTAAPTPAATIENSEGACATTTTDTCGSGSKCMDKSLCSSGIWTAGKCCSKPNDHNYVCCEISEQRADAENERYYKTITGIGSAMALAAQVGKAGASPEDQGMWDAISTSIAAGTIGADIAHIWIESPYAAGGIGLAVAAIAFAVIYKEDTKRSIVYEGHVWQPPVGGKFCDECNKMAPLPCSEYQCRSLGQACELVNQGTSDEACVWINPRDVNPPQLRPLEAALLSNFRYQFDEGEMISPPDRGVEVQIINEDSTTGCIPAFMEFSFGLNASESAQCKIDYIRTDDFESMEYYFGGSNLFKTQHKQVMRASQLVSEEGEGLDLENDQEYEMAVRCQDKNSNYNKGEIVFKFCVEAALDTTPALIVATDPENGLPFAFNITSMNINVYTNEAAACSWSHVDQEYSEMENAFNCPATSPQDFNAQMVYRCSGEVDNLESREDNEIYIRCRDQPNVAEEDRNSNMESHVLTLIGTGPLDISSVSPEEGDVLSDNTERIEVLLGATTSAGFKDGQATCYFSDTEGGPYSIFLNTVGHSHSSSELLAEGSYTYYIRCVDYGGNSYTTSTTFDVETDFDSPEIVRLYKDRSQLKIITGEIAECVYGLDNCDYPFDDGIRMRNVDNVAHVADWDSDKTFYVKCRDDYLNQPTAQDECSVIVQPFETHVSA